MCKKADVDLTKRAGELSDEEVEKLITIMGNPRQYKIPDWFLNRQKDVKDGKYSQVSIIPALYLRILFPCITLPKRFPKHLYGKAPNWFPKYYVMHITDSLT